MPPSPDELAITSEFLALQEAVAGRYSLVRELGRGGSAVVFLARDATLDRLVAIKLLRSELVAEAGTRTRFLQEARTAARLNHPCIVPVHAVEEAGELVYLVMAYVDGESLGSRVRRAGPLSPAAVRKVMRQVAWALAAAHDAGVVHLDVKPDNILLERGTGRALLTDFGIARLRVDGEGTPGPRGSVVGTPRYMSPEQLAGASVDGRSDLFSLGVTAHFALTATWPQDKGSSGSDGGGRSRSAVVAGGGGTASRALVTAINRCLAVDPDQRPHSAAAVAAEVGEADAVPFSLPYRGRKLVRDLRQYVLAALGGSVAVVLWPAPGLFIGGVVGLVVLGSFIGSARALLREGYDPELLQDVILEEVQGLFTERGGSAESWWGRAWEKVRNGLIRAGPALTALGVAGLVPAWLLGPELPVVWGTTAAVGLLGSLLVGAGPPAPSDSALRHLDWAERMLGGRFGRVLFWVSRRLAPLPWAPSRRREPDRPTEVVLARASQELFQALPASVQGRFSELPEVAGKLEGQVEVLRARDRELAEALAQVDAPAGGDVGGERDRTKVELEEERARVDARLREAVAALEHLRLSLARLTADTTAPGIDQLDGDLERARQAGRERATAGRLPDR